MGAVSSGGQLLLAVDAGGPGSLLVLRDDLGVVSRTPLGFRPRGLWRAPDGRLLLSGAQPAALYALDPGLAVPRLVDSVPDGSFGGTVTGDGDRVFWAVPPAGQVREVDADGRTRTFTVCPHIQDMVVSGDRVLAACSQPGRVALVDLVSGTARLGDGGEFPDSVVLAP